MGMTTRMNKEKTETMTEPQQPLKQQLTERLQQQFAPEQLILHDDSHLHAGHAGAADGGQHYRLTIVSNAFVGQSRVARHRMVYDSLADLMQQKIHALAIHALSPQEALLLPDRTR